MIHIVRRRATPAMMSERLQSLGSYVKLAVDVRREVLAGGGELHADCEQALLEDGSRQEDIWGADWPPSSQKVQFEAPINIRPRQNNPGMTIQDPAIRARVEAIARQLLEGVMTE
ncbi:MAG TPA: hypothetical protein EYP49_08690 [Anaerolineae bacterium]|nr:hypothetical protein [Anaerolineae bacterium]